MDNKNLVQARRVIAILSLLCLCAFLQPQAVRADLQPQANDTPVTPLPTNAGKEAMPQAQGEKDVQQQDWDAKSQTTYIGQRKLPFSAPYTGPNSLQTQKEKAHTLTATAYLGVRPWPGGEFYLDPEMIQGVPYSNLQGLGGPTNGALQKVAGPNPIFYVPRVFVRQTWGFGGGTEAVESAFNQLAGPVDKRRLVLTAGQGAIVDLFDNNLFNHDPRTTFQNWTAIDYGPFDYAADARGFSIGATLEYYHDDWTGC